MSALNDLRQKFVDYFAAREHHILPSAPLVPQHDPTLLFINAGMAPLKDFFTGQRPPPSPRAVSVQKCLRAGGKHNDLDNVGYTARHHTFFEMLGNFSFGDYFKEEAIAYAWEFVAQELGLDKNRLLVTFFAADEQAGKLWRKISGLPQERIISIADSDNFWSMGETGPCGPCSEIFYDHGADIPGTPPHKGGEGDRFVEIWNLVFMQYESIAGGTRRDLPRPAIDTGMGLERIAAAMQGTHNNYETDLFRALVNASVEATGQPASEQNIASHRVIADHLRAVCFLIADGVSPANEGRGYVLRRILRRAMSHGHLLGVREPSLYRLTAAVEKEMAAAWPELKRARASIAETVRQEEERFQDMLGRGLRLLEDEAAKAKGGLFSGEAAFRLYDTYGFPLDLTSDILRRRNIAIDNAGFEAAMAEQKTRARAAWSGSGDAAQDALWPQILGDKPATEFLGYDHDEADACILAIIRDGKEAEQCAAGEEAAVLLDCTPFYAESGGQVGDAGKLRGDDALFQVSATSKQADGFHIHQGRVEKGVLRKGQKIRAAIDASRRAKLRANHSATHLLNAALHEVLGDHVVQRGSLVAPDYLRFDFTHRAPLTAQEVARIEAIVNAQIRNNLPVETKIMPANAAMEKGAMTVPGEEYPEQVRVLSMGMKGGVKGRAHWSVELCAGTHVGRTGDIMLFHITGQSAIGAGIRRIEGMTGEAARLYLKAREEKLLEAARVIKSAPDELPERAGQMLKEVKDLRESVKQLRGKAALAPAGQGAGDDVEEIGGVKVLSRLLEGVPAGELRSLADDAMQRLGSGVVVLAAVNDGKAALTVKVSKDLSASHNAVELVKAGAAILGSKGGGGRPDMAQAGGPDGKRAREAVAAIRERL